MDVFKSDKYNLKIYAISNWEPVQIVIMNLYSAKTIEECYVCFCLSGLVFFVSIYEGFQNAGAYVDVTVCFSNSDGCAFFLHSFMTVHSVKGYVWPCLRLCLSIAFILRELLTSTQTSNQTTLWLCC